MTIISINAPVGRIDGAARAVLAMTLTDAVLEPEVGKAFAPARSGFQVWFHEVDLNAVAIGGQLLSTQACPVDVIHLDIAVMDGYWPPELRGRVISRVLRAVANALGLPDPAATWWVTFRVIDEGSWGSRGGPLSILSLLTSGAFSDTRQEAIRNAMC